MSVVYLFTLAFAKLALLMLYYRLLHVLWAWEYIIYALAFIIIGYTLSLALAIIFACSPIQKSWDVTITYGHCINRPVIYLMTTVTNTTSDVVLLLIPFYIVRGLRLPLIQKVGVAFLLGLGSLWVFTLGHLCVTPLTPIERVIATSILRLATIWPLVNLPDIPHKVALESLFMWVLWRISWYSLLRQ